MTRPLVGTSATLALLLLPLAAAAGEPRWAPIPRAGWRGAVDAQVATLNRRAAVTVALPSDKARSLTATSPSSHPAGVYELRVTVRPSHVGDAIAFHARLNIAVDGKTVADFAGCHFARAHQPETRRCRFVHPAPGPVKLDLRAHCDAAVAEKAWVAANLERGGPKHTPIAGGLLADDDGDGDDLGLDLDGALELTVDPDGAVYYLVDAIELRRLSRSGHVTAVTTDKIRYRPGETLSGTATVTDAGGAGGRGTLHVYLEHNVDDRTKVASLDVTLAARTRTVSFHVPLPREEFGYALVAEYVSADGRDRSEAAEYFNIAEQFQRVAIFGGGLATRDVVLDDAAICASLEKARAGYVNATEYFAWAEDDLVEMSPDADFWSSGQTNYRMHKRTIQRQIALAHERGMAVATYGKFVMSGIPGWKTAYDYPNDHRGQYNYPVGTWAGVHVPTLDRLRDGDVRVYSKSPRIKGDMFHTWWAGPRWINPDTTPRMVRIAAEECARSVDMFGWDMVRWDGHPRGGGHWVQCGRSGKYQAWAARKTQSLVRYFKEIVGGKHPGFAHGYNYLLIEKAKGYDWAVEDYELDELCRGGGLIMNESIGNASAGWTFAEIARNLQTDGDLCRERGGCYLGISFGNRNPPRDVIIESALWAAAGCRPYNDAMSRAVRRYCTRYSQYTFDERLRRLTKPEKVIAPRDATRLWWQPFVYETPLVAGRRQLVVNLLNLPLQDRRPARSGEVKPTYDMPPGTDPVTFEVTLPTGVRATAASLVDPLTLSVTKLPLEDNRFTVPAVATWRVAILDLDMARGAPSLAALYGPPKTLGVKRQGLAQTERKPDVVLDPEVDIWEVNKRIGTLAPEWEVKRAEEQRKLDALDAQERARTLLERRPTPDDLKKKWWKGAAIPTDLALENRRPSFGNLTPERNGRFDVFYARGAMDYRLRIPIAFAGLARFRVHDAALSGSVQKSPHMGLAGGVAADRYPEFDLLVFTGIPHAAIGVKSSYGLVDYVKAGGGVFFTGGEFAFGKGGYMHTVLERELVPLQCTAMVDTVYTDRPRHFEPGPHFGELDVRLDFAARPSFWVRNEVVLRPDARVFIQSDGRPILVGRTLGKGRVACLLVDHRGKSEDGVTAFFDWDQWPELACAVMRWLAPEAHLSRPRAAASRAAASAIAKLRQLADGDDVISLDAIDADDDFGDDLPGTRGAATGTELGAADLKGRLRLLDNALAGSGPGLSDALAAQLGTVTNLPLRARMRILAALRGERPKRAAALGRDALKSDSSALHANGYALLALAGEAAFARAIASPPPVRVETADQKRERLHDLAIALALYPKADLVTEGARRLAAMDRAEATVRAEFARTCGEDTAMLDTSPCLDADATLARLAWLAYLSRHDARTYGRTFLREWLKTGQYVDYCWRTREYLVKQHSLAGARAEAVKRQWANLARRFAGLQRLTRADAQAILTRAPDEAAAALSQARFKPERYAAMNLIGDLDPVSSRRIVGAMSEATHPDIAAFARARERAR